MTGSRVAPSRPSRNFRFKAPEGKGSRFPSLGRHRVGLSVIPGLFSAFLLGAIPASHAGGTLPSETLRHSQSIEELIGQGKERLDSGRGKEAIPLFKKAVALDPRSARAHMLLGYSYRMVASYEFIAEAKAELRQAIALDPDLSWARFYLAHIYLDLGRVEKAREELAEALDREPKNPFFLTLFGEVLRRSGNPRLAIVYHQNATRESPALSIAHYYAGLALLDLRRSEEALRELERAAAGEDTLAEMHVALGSAYIDSGRYREAVVELKRALTLDPQRAETHLKLAKAYRLIGQSESAFEELQRLQQGQQLQIQSPYFQEVSAEVSFELGMLHREAGRREAAIEAFQEALRIKENHPGAHRELAVAYFERKDYSTAREHAGRALELGETLEEPLLVELGLGSEPAP